MKFRDKVAIVTGSGQGIGKRIAEKLGAEGTTVVISDVNLDTAQQTAKEIEKTFLIKTAFLKADVKKRADVYSLMDFTVKNFGKIDILVNNAGILYQTKVDEISQKEWDEVLAVNLRGVFFCCQAVMHYMKKHKQGRILNIASSAGKIGGILAGAHYSASKAGVICLTKVFARELAPFEVTVNAIAPGFVETSLIEGFPSEAIENYKKSCPLGTLVDTDDVAEAAIFLLSDGAKHITGEILDVNGGILMD
jgi:3-oxoacyl-[acyl-carrier protein] reductase